jgi:hypothetical protein
VRVSGLTFDGRPSSAEDGRRASRGAISTCGVFVRPGHGRARLGRDQETDDSERGSEGKGREREDRRTNQLLRASLDDDVEEGGTRRLLSLS